MSKAVAIRALSDDELARINGFDAALAALDHIGATVESYSDYGTGFAVLKDKQRLVGEAFVILEWRFSFSKEYLGADGLPAEFVSAYLVTESGAKVILVDGSTGICAQLKAVTERRIGAGHRTPQQGLVVRGGLSASNYTVEDAKGRKSSATTYYLAD